MNSRQLSMFLSLLVVFGSSSTAEAWNGPCPFEADGSPCTAASCRADSDDPTCMAVTSAWCRTTPGDQGCRSPQVHPMLTVWQQGEDSYEGNDGYGDAFPLDWDPCGWVLGTGVNGNAVATNEDWFEIELEDETELSLILSADGPVEAQIYLVINSRVPGSPLGVVTGSGTWQQSVEAGTYRVRLFNTGSVTKGLQRSYRLLLSARPDFDQDGYVDASDVCPHHWDSGQIDSDDDGAGDVCDEDIRPTVYQANAFVEHPLAWDAPDKQWWHIRAYGSHPLTQYNPEITQAVILIHGNGGATSEEHYGGAERAFNSAASVDVERNTLIFLPQFRYRGTSLTPPSYDTHRMYWGRWTSGGLSRQMNDGRPRVSSFTVIDDSIVQLADRETFPHLERIVVAGHSGGGQFAHRYAMAGQAELEINGVTVEYVAANPAFWTWPGPTRPTTTTPELECGADYDDYPFGTQAVDYTYHLDHGVYGDVMREQLATRRLHVVLGEDDVCRQDGDPYKWCVEQHFNMDCEADLEGPNRLERGWNFVDATMDLYPDAPHTITTMPGFGHTSGVLFDISSGKRIVWGRGYFWEP